MGQFSDHEKRAEAVREVAMRKSVYRGMVRSGKIMQREADRAIAIMQEIADDYAARAPNLFSHLGET